MCLAIGNVVLLCNTTNSRLRVRRLSRPNFAATSQRRPASCPRRTTTAREPLRVKQLPGYRRSQILLSDLAFVYWRQDMTAEGGQGLPELSIWADDDHAW